MSRAHEFGAVDQYRRATARDRRCWLRHRVLAAAVAAITALAPAGVAVMATARPAAATLTTIDLGALSGLYHDNWAAA